MFDIADQLETLSPVALAGRVTHTAGMTVAVSDFPACMGALVEIECQSGDPIEAEVIGFQGEQTIVYPFRSLVGVRRGSRVRLLRTVRTLQLGEQLLGRVIDAHGNAMDGKPQPVLPQRGRIDQNPPSAFERPRIDTPLSTGVRAIDGLLTCGRGQRLGIFAGSGVGKSVLLGMMSRYTEADVNVIALIGERGREVNEFIQRDLGPEGLQKSVVVVATSDQPALLRTNAAFVATTIAEYFRDLGNNVLLLMDSITRFAIAQREIGLAAGEPPTTRGYPPSVFAQLPRIVERAGRSRQGSITGYYSVLVEGDDHNEPVADAMRGLLDGHIVLSRKIASSGHYPAIDVLESISRLMTEIASPDHLQAVQRLRQVMSAYRENEDLVSIGAYRAGSNPDVDAAIALKDEINSLLTQSVSEGATLESACQRVVSLGQKINNLSKVAHDRTLSSGQPMQQAQQSQFLQQPQAEQPPL